MSKKIQWSNTKGKESKGSGIGWTKISSQLDFSSSIGKLFLFENPIKLQV